MSVLYSWLLILWYQFKNGRAMGAPSPVIFPVQVYWRVWFPLFHSVGIKLSLRLHLLFLSFPHKRSVYVQMDLLGVTSWLVCLKEGLLCSCESSSWALKTMMLQHAQHTLCQDESTRRKILKMPFDRQLSKSLKTLPLYPLSNQWGKCYHCPHF